MAKVAVSVPGREQSFADATTVADLKAALGLNANFTASVNGSPVEDGFRLSDNQFVVLAAPVKGG